MISFGVASCCVSYEERGLIISALVRCRVFAHVRRQLWLDWEKKRAGSLFSKKETVCWVAFFKWMYDVFVIFVCFFSLGSACLIWISCVLVCLFNMLIIIIVVVVVVVVVIIIPRFFLPFLASLQVLLMMFGRLTGERVDETKPGFDQHPFRWVDDWCRCGMWQPYSFLRYYKNLKLVARSGYHTLNIWYSSLSLSKAGLLSCFWGFMSALHSTRLLPANRHIDALWLSDWCIQYMHVAMWSIQYTVYVSVLLVSPIIRPEYGLNEEPIVDKIKTLNKALFPGVSQFPWLLSLLL